MKLKVDPEFEKLGAKMNFCIYEGIREDIKEHGLIKPIDVDETNTILDGHHRYKACTELKMEIPDDKVIVHTEFKTREEKKDYICRCQLTKMQTPFEKVELGMHWLSIEAEKAKQRMKTGTLASKDTEVGKTAEIIAKRVGLGQCTFERGKKIIESKPPDIILKRLRDFDIGIREVYEFITMLEQFPEDKGDEFREEFKEGKVDILEIKQVHGHSRAAEESLNDYNELIQAQMKPKFESIMWTRKFNDNQLRQLQHDLLVASGGNPKLKTKRVEASMFEDDEDAENFAKRLGGILLGKVTVEYYEMEIDPLKEA